MSFASEQESSDGRDLRMGFRTKAGGACSQSAVDTTVPDARIRKVCWNSLSLPLRDIDGASSPASEEGSLRSLAVLWRYSEKVSRCRSCNSSTVYNQSGCFVGKVP